MPHPKILDYCHLFSHFLKPSLVICVVVSFLNAANLLHAITDLLLLSSPNSGGLRW